MRTTTPSAPRDEVHRRRREVQADGQPDRDLDQPRSRIDRSRERVVGRRVRREPQEAAVGETCVCVRKKGGFQSARGRRRLMQC